MYSKPSSSTQLTLEGTLLSPMVPPDNRWRVLASIVPWDEIEEKFKDLFEPSKGAPNVPIGRVVGLLIIRQMKKLSDEEVIDTWSENICWQWFCGETEHQTEPPLSTGTLSTFRKRIGEEGVKFLFEVSVKIHGKEALEDRVCVDTTVQPKNITYPTDAKLCVKIMNNLHKVIKKTGIVPRRSYVRELKKLRLPLRFFHHPKKKKESRRALKRLKTITGALLRDARRKLPQEALKIYSDNFRVYEQFLKQKLKDKNKIYSLREKEVYCVAKGKAGKKYEFGSKCSIVRGYKSGVIVGAAVHQGNPHDSKTLESALDNAETIRGKSVKEVCADRGYRGKTQVKDAKVPIPGSSKYDGGYTKTTLKRVFRKRAGIEPVIGHLKSDFKLDLCRLKGRSGDVFNLFVSCLAWNLKLRLRAALRLFFVSCVKIQFFVIFLSYFDQIEFRKTQHAQVHA